MSFDESEDPDVGAWKIEQRANVLEYLAGEGVEHGGVNADPAWSEAPYVAIWAVQSLKSADAVGWWVISGDVPTDYVSSSEVRDARNAMRVFGRRWSRASRQMAQGKQPDEIHFGKPNEWVVLAPMLASRAIMLSSWADDDDIWS